MIHVDFYITGVNTPKERFPFVCSLIEKAYQEGHQVYVYTNDNDETHFLDNLLWTYKDDEFIPHQSYTSSAKAPILIGSEEPIMEKSEILINLTQVIPSFYEKFKRIVEIVPQEATWRNQLRSNYKLYQERSCELKSHDLSKTKQTA